MTRVVFALVAALAVAAGCGREAAPGTSAGGSGAPAAKASEAPPVDALTNEAIIGLAAANVPKDVILSKINTTPNVFDITLPGLVSLTQGRVRTDVIQVMIAMAADPRLGKGPKTNEVLDNQAVMTMVTTKLPKPIIIAKIQNTPAAYDVTPAGIVALTQAKVPSDVVQAMVLKDSAKK